MARLLIGLAVGAAVTYTALVVALLLLRPERGRLAEAIRLGPDLLRFVGRLARSTAVPRSSRTLLWALFGYLALPIDLIPDVIPVIGYADDVILAAAVLRFVLRRSDREALLELWPGTPDGLRAVERLIGPRRSRGVAPGARR